MDFSRAPCLSDPQNQAAEIEDRHRRFRETTTESFQTQISALREELQASRREHDMQVLALERKAAADKQAVIAESKQRVQLLGECETLLTSELWVWAMLLAPHF